MPAHTQGVFVWSGRKYNLPYVAIQHWMQIMRALALRMNLLMTLLFFFFPRNSRGLFVVEISNAGTFSLLPPIFFFLTCGVHSHCFRLLMDPLQDKSLSLCRTNNCSCHACRNLFFALRHSPPNFLSLSLRLAVFRYFHNI